jgi:hypothetical protein
MLTTADEELSIIMHRFAEEKRTNRRYDFDEHANFLNWAGSERIHRADVNTTTILAKALEAANRMGISYHITPKEIVIGHPNGDPYKGAETGGIWRYVPQGVSRVKWRDELIQGPNNDEASYEWAKYLVGSFAN